MLPENGDDFVPVLSRRNVSFGPRITKVHDIGNLLVCDTDMVVNDPKKYVLLPMHNLMSCMMTNKSFSMAK